MIFVNGTLAVDEYLFAGNVALENAGGAIRVTGTMNVSNTSFVDNRAASTGGAIANSSTTPGTVTIDSSCFDGNCDVAVDSLASARRSSSPPARTVRRSGARRSSRASPT